MSNHLVNSYRLPVGIFHNVYILYYVWCLGVKTLKMDFPTKLFEYNSLILCGLGKKLCKCSRAESHLVLDYFKPFYLTQIKSEDCNLSEITLFVLLVKCKQIKKMICWKK